MIRIFLTGYMGAGKTTLGKALAREMHVQFIDLDWFIEARFRQTVAQIFASRGEEGFRLLERDMLREVGEFEDVVISTGGGTPCFFDNMSYMKQQGHTVYLKADIETLLVRLTISKQKRPVLQNRSGEELRAFITTALTEREPFYTLAHYVFDSSRLENTSQIAESVNKLRQLLEI